MVIEFLPAQWKSCKHSFKEEVDRRPWVIGCMSGGRNLGRKELLAQDKSQLRFKIYNMLQDSGKVPSFLLSLGQNQDSSLTFGPRALLLCNENFDSNFSFYHSACESFFSTNFTVFLNICLNLFIEGGVCTCNSSVPKHTCGGQRTIFRNRFSSPTMWVLDIKCKSSGLVTNSFPCWTM